MRKLGLTLIHRRLEWQMVGIDHIFRVLRVRAPAAPRFGRYHRPGGFIPLIVGRN